MENVSLYQDRVFRQIVVTSTALGLSCMFGSLAALQIKPGAGFQFIWHWSILAIVAAVVVWNRRLWNLVWASQETPLATTPRKLIFHIALLVLLGLGAFLYPIRFIEQSYWNGILRGLVTAGLFLGTMVWIIYQIGKSLKKDAAEFGQPQDSGSAA